MMKNHSFRNRVHAFSALYPIPVIFAAMLAVAVCCLSLAATVDGPLGWMSAALAVGMVLSESALVGYVVACKSDLPRVERESITVRGVDRA